MNKLESIAKYDIKKTDEMFQAPYGSSKFTTYDRVYSETNEPCDKIISKFDVKDKSVLTVLGSGDQAIQFYVNGAKNVDLFDINKLTIYYYYLRIWHMKKYGTMYPEDIFNSNYFKEILKYVNPSSYNEKLAYLYWNRFISKFDSDKLNNFFNNSFYRKINEDVNSELVLKKISEDDFSFHNLDFTLPFDLSKKYDFIYTSNLSDYIKDERLKIYRDNLYNHLNKGGIVLSSNLSGSINCHKYVTQRRALRRYFKFRNIRYFNKEFMEVDDIGYSYKKRRIKRII